MQNKHSRCSFTAVIKKKLLFFFLTYEFLFQRESGTDSSSFWIIELHCCGSRLIHRFPLLSQRAEFPLALVTLTLSPDALVLVPSVFACLSWSKDHQWVTRGEMCEDVLQTGPDAPPGRTRDAFMFCTYSVCSCSSLHSNKPGHNSFIPPSSGFTATLGIYCCNSVYVCTLPLHHCPWLGDNLPSFPASPSSGPFGSPLPTYVEHTCYMYVRCTRFSLILYSSSAPNIYWFNHQPGLLHRPLCSKLKKKGGAVKELGGGQDMTLTLGCDSHIRQTASYLQTMRTCSIFLDLSTRKHTDGEQMAVLWWPTREQWNKEGIFSYSAWLMHYGM